MTTTASVASGTHADFPFLVNIATSTYLKTTSTDANGRIQSVNGYDLIFSTSTDCICRR